MNKYRVYCGPTVVEHAAAKLRTAGLDVTLLGTEHVYVDAVSHEVVLMALGTTGWSYRDVAQLS